MTPTFDRVRQLLRGLPGVGHRSAERLALHLLVERPAKLAPILEALAAAATAVGRCRRCGNLAEGEACSVCADPRRDPTLLCVVENVPDLLALERTGSFRGTYHVLHGRLSPINGVGPGELNLASLGARLVTEPVAEIVLALGNDIEGEATCHYIRESFLSTRLGTKVTDAETLRSSLEGRRDVGG